jgi:hypothetical protein
MNRFIAVVVLFRVLKPDGEEAQTDLNSSAVTFPHCLNVIAEHQPLLKIQQKVFMSAIATSIGTLTYSFDLVKVSKFIRKRFDGLL